LGEQEDVYEMIAVLPGAWFEKKRYDWSKNGSVSISISSIWKGFLAGHSYSFAIPLPSAKTDNKSDPESGRGQSQVPESGRNGRGQSQVPESGRNGRGHPLAVSGQVAQSNPDATHHYKLMAVF
jgi:hypothetical protein